MIVKGYNIHKNPITPIIKLEKNGLTIINKKLGNQFYDFTEILSIKMNSIAFNGYLKLKNEEKKIIIDSMAIKLSDQREIVNLVISKI